MKTEPSSTIAAKQKKKIAVFGGSFDPVHKAHIKMAKLAIDVFNLEKVIFVAAYTPPHKTRQFADIYDRIAMLKIAVSGMQKAEISFYEAEKQDVVYSYQTLDYFQGLYPENEILMIIGSDSLLDLPTWKKIDYLVSKYRFIIAKRPDVEIKPDTKYIERCLFMDTVMDDVSSTGIRKLLQKNDKKAADYLDENVYSYIKENGLYK